MKEIQINVNDVNVKGVILIQKHHDISVEITEPFTKLTSSRHAPHFAHAHTDFSGEYGIERAKSLLEDLFNLCTDIDSKKDEIKDIIVLHDKEYSHFTELIEEQKELMTSLKKQFKKSDRNSLEYHKQTNQIRTSLNDFSSERNSLGDKYFGEMVGDNLMIEFQHIEYFRSLSD